MRSVISYLRRVPRIPNRMRREIRGRLVPIPIVNRYRRNNVQSREKLTLPEGPIVSLTTHGSRIDTVYLTIESIASGSMRPSRLILWLDNQSLYDHMPDTLRRLVTRGLEVRLCGNYGPHTKYYPFVESHQAFDAPLVTA